MSKKVTKEQIAEWKAKHEDVFKLSVDGKVCYLKRPTRQIISAAEVSAGENSIKFNESIIRDSWLGGDMEFQTEDSLFFGVSKQIDKIIDTAKVELEKL